MENEIIIETVLIKFKLTKEFNFEGKSEKLTVYVKKVNNSYAVENQCENGKFYFAEDNNDYKILKQMAVCSLIKDALYFIKNKETEVK